MPEADAPAARRTGVAEITDLARPPPKRVVRTEGLVVMASPEALRNLPIEVEVLGSVQEWVHRKLAGGLAHSTKTSYSESWAKWLWWCNRRGISPLLEGETRQHVHEDEEEILRFIGFLGWLGKGNGTLTSVLFAFQGGHVRAGGGDPLRGKKRIEVLLISLQKGGPKEERKLGVTARMMVWLKNELKPRPPRRGLKEEERREELNAAVMWAILSTGVFYLCRAKELGDSGGVDPDMCLRGIDVGLRAKDGSLAPRGVGRAAQAIVTFRKTKTDQRAFGARRTHHRADAPACPVEAFEILREHCPERFVDGVEGRKPLFRWSSGKVVKREQLQAALRRAAAAEGLPARRFKPHSLRIGGVSALWHALGDAEAVKRWGRWSSTAFHGYLYDSAEQSQGVSAAMANDVATLHGA